MESRLSPPRPETIESMLLGEDVTWRSGGLTFKGQAFDLGHAYGVGTQLANGRRYAVRVPAPTAAKLLGLVEELYRWVSNEMALHG